MFDAGLISFDGDGVLLVSSAVPSDDRSLLGLDHQRLMKAPPIRTMEYLDYHRRKIFRQ